MRFDILELTEIPRERDKLKAIIGSARYQQRKGRMIRLTAYVMIGMGVLVLLIGACSAPPSPHPAVFLPLVLR